MGSAQNRPIISHSERSYPPNMEPWLKGLIAAVVGGAATAGGSWMAINAAGAAGAAVPVLNWKSLGIILLVGAVTNLFAYLKQSPIPSTIEQTQITVTKESTKKESTRETN